MISLLTQHSQFDPNYSRIRKMLLFTFLQLKNHSKCFFRKNVDKRYIKTLSQHSENMTDSTFFEPRGVLGSVLCKFRLNTSEIKVHVTQIKMNQTILNQGHSPNSELVHVHFFQKYLMSCSELFFFRRTSFYLSLPSPNHCNFPNEINYYILLQNNKHK